LRDTKGVNTYEGSYKNPLDPKTGEFWTKTPAIKGMAE